MGPLSRHRPLTAFRGFVWSISQKFSSCEESVFGLCAGKRTHSAASGWTAKQVVLQATCPTTSGVLSNHSNGGSRPLLWSVARSGLVLVSGRTLGGSPTLAQRARDYKQDPIPEQMWSETHAPPCVKALPTARGSRDYFTFLLPLLDCLRLMSAC